MCVFLRLCACVYITLCMPECTGCLWLCIFLFACEYLSFMHVDSRCFAVYLHTVVAVGYLKGFVHQWKLLCFIETITTCRYNEAWERAAVTTLLFQRKVTVGSIYRPLLKSCVSAYLKIFRKAVVEESIKIFDLKVDFTDFHPASCGCSLGRTCTLYEMY